VKLQRSSADFGIKNNDIEPENGYLLKQYEGITTIYLGPTLFIRFVLLDPAHRAGLVQNTPVNGNPLTLFYF